MTDIEKRLDALQKQAKVFADCVSNLTMSSSYVEVKNMIESYRLLYERFRDLVD